MAIKSSATITLSSVVDVAATTRYYLLQSSTLAFPAKPITQIPGSGWTDAEPAYTSASTNSLYFVDRTDFSDGTWAYSNVSLSSSYEAAKEAYNKSIIAQEAAYEAMSPDAIYNRASGQTVELTDCIDAPITDLGLHGCSTQGSSPGYNLFHCVGSGSSGNVRFSWSDNTRLVVSGNASNKAVTMNVTSTSSTFLKNLFNAHIGETCRIRTVVTGTTGNVSLLLVGYKSSTMSMPTNAGLSFTTTAPYATPYLRVSITSSTTVIRTYRIQITFGEDNLPYTDYTGGLPTPNAEFPESIASAAPSGVMLAFNGRQCYIPFKEPLAGLPVNTAGTYEDASGQQWLADTLHFKDRRYIQRIGKRILTGEEDWTAVTEDGIRTFRCTLPDAAVSGGADTIPALCTRFRSAPVDTVHGGTDDNVFSLGSTKYCAGNVLMVRYSAYTSVSTFTARLAAIQPVLYYQLAEPVVSEIPLACIAEFNRMQTFAPSTAISCKDAVSPYIEVEYLRNVAGAQGVIAANAAKLESQDNTDALRTDTLNAIQAIDEDVTILGTELNQTRDALEARVLRSDMETYIRYSVVDNHGTVEIGQRDSTSESAYKTQTDNEGFRVIQSGNAMAEIRKNCIVSPVIEARRMIRLGDHTIKLSSTGHLNFC